MEHEQRQSGLPNTSNIHLVYQRPGQLHLQRLKPATVIPYMAPGLVGAENGHSKVQTTPIWLCGGSTILLKSDKLRRVRKRIGICHYRNRILACCRYELSKFHCARAAADSFAFHCFAEEIGTTRRGQAASEWHGRIRSLWTITLEAVKRDGNPKTSPKYLVGTELAEKEDPSNLRKVRLDPEAQEMSFSGPS